MDISADTPPLLFHSIAASTVQQGRSCAPRASAWKRRNRSQCRCHVVTKCNGPNLQIGTSQIDVHEPAARLSQEVISI
jgi:hypothetical protein